MRSHLLVQTLQRFLSQMVWCGKIRDTVIEETRYYTRYYASSFHTTHVKQNENMREKGIGRKNWGIMIKNTNNGMESKGLSIASIVKRREKKEKGKGQKRPIIEKHLLSIKKSKVQVLSDTWNGMITINPYNKVSQENLEKLRDRICTLFNWYTISIWERHVKSCYEG